MNNYLSPYLPAYVGNPVQSIQSPGISIGKWAGNYLDRAAAAPGVDPTFMDGMLGYTDAQGNKTQGWGGLALGSLQGLTSAYLGMKNYGIAKDQLALNKQQFALNYDAQRATTNAALEDRQRARVASNPGAYVSVGAYMDKNGIKGR